MPKPDQAEAFEKLLADLKQATTEARQTLKDLRGALREANDVIHTVPERVDREFGNQVKAELDSIAKRTAQAIRETETRIRKRLDGVLNVALGTPDPDEQDELMRRAAERTRDALMAVRHHPDQLMPPPAFHRLRRVIRPQAGSREQD